MRTRTILAVTIVAAVAAWSACAKEPDMSEKTLAVGMKAPAFTAPSSEGKIITAYGVWKKSSMFGKTALGINRSTFLIDQDGVIRKIWRGVNVDGHDKEVLEAVKSL